MMTSRWLKFSLGSIALFVVLGVGFVLRLYLVECNERYFRNETDGKNFNRMVEMASSGTIQSDAVSQPQFGVYARLPILKASIWIAQKRGELGSLADLQTRNPYGPDGFALAVSHPTVLRINRLFSVALSLLVVALTYIITLQLGQGIGIAFIAALVPSLSQAMLKTSYVITADVLTTFLCLLVTSCAIRAVTSKNNEYVYISALSAGLAVASSYYAVPILIAPIVTIVLDKRTPTALVLVGALAIVSFFCANPYALLSPFELASNLEQALLGSKTVGDGHLSIDHLISKSTIYLGWFLLEGVGVAAGGLALASLVYFAKSMNKKLAVFIAFPIAHSFVLLLSREMMGASLVLMVPYVAIMAACGMARLGSVAVHPSVRRGAGPALGALIVLQLSCLSILYIRGEGATDSRDILAQWIMNERPASVDIAIAGSLQIAPRLGHVPQVDIFDPATNSLPRLLQAGYSYVVAPAAADSFADAELYSEVLRLQGSSDNTGPFNSPPINIYKLNDTRLDLALARSPASLLIRPTESPDIPSCQTDGERFCWISSRRTKVHIQVAGAKPSRARLSILSPWPNQTVTVFSALGSQLVQRKVDNPNEWVELQFSLPRNHEFIIVDISDVHSVEPTTALMAPNRVGVALRTLMLEDELSSREDGTSSVLRGYPEPIRLAIKESFTVQIEDVSPRDENPKQGVQDVSRKPVAEKLESFVSSQNGESSRPEAAPADTVTSGQWSVNQEREAMARDFEARQAVLDAVESVLNEIDAESK